MLELNKLIKIILPDLLKLLRSEESCKILQKGLDKSVVSSIHCDEEKNDD